MPYFLRAKEPYQAQPYDVQLPDGDVLVLHDDRPAGWSPQDRIVVLVHGLGGCHGSGYMVRLAATIRRDGFRVMRMDMRGCGAGLLRARGVFHAGRSEDLLAAIRFIASHFPGSPITACGFSLGANLTLKMLGETGDEPPPQLDSALAVEPPIDLGYCCDKLSRGPGRIYDRFFAKFLWNDFDQRRRLLAGADRVTLKRAPSTLLAFDRAITAPLAGFDTADEYYRSASAADVLEHITTPTVVLTAADDPIVPVDVFDGVRLSPAIQLFVSEGGGHLGFYSVADEHAPDRRWMDHRLLEWIREIDQSSAAAGSRARRMNAQRGEERQHTRTPSDCASLEVGTNAR